MEKIRPSWDEYFISIMLEVAKRSTCIRRQVGAILVKDRIILSTGYNGAVKGLPHCKDSGCLREKNNISNGMRHELCSGLHAEQNAILFSSKMGKILEGAVLYSTNYPCSICAKMLIQVGIKKIVYLDDYPDDLSKKLFSFTNIEIVKFSKS